jgi:hypothetical protein
VRTKRARFRLSSGGNGGYLVNKFVKQTKINSRFTYERGFNQATFVKTKPDKRARCTRVLWEPNPAMRQKDPKLKDADGKSVKLKEGAEVEVTIEAARDAVEKKTAYVSAMGFPLWGAV